VTGLTGTVVLQDNGGDDLSLNADGSFAFATTLSEGLPYAVTVRTHPTGQTCLVASGSGTMGTADAVVTVTCTTSPVLSSFGQACDVTVGCTGEFNVCQNFPNPDPTFYGCTKHCTANTDCPSGSQGQKCNNSGLCRP
jgi:hypothetical protein